jgi:hypothetical protein
MGLAPPTPQQATRTRALTENPCVGPAMALQQELCTFTFVASEGQSRGALGSAGGCFSGAQHVYAWDLGERLCS